MKYFEKQENAAKPRTDNFHEYIELLERSYYVREINSLTPVPVFSLIHLHGLPCPIYSNRLSAEKMMLEMETAYEKNLEVAQISGLWDFIILCAERGMCGLVVDNDIGITFFNRLSDIDRNLPSLMWIRFHDKESKSFGFFFSRRGVVETKSGTTVRWINQNRFDKVINSYVLYDQPLRDRLDAHAIFLKITDPENSKSSWVNPIFPSGCTFLGPYVSEVGAIPIFSSYEFAFAFAKLHGINIEDSRSNEDYSISKVNLIDFLDSVYDEHNVFVDIGLNPTAHRSDQGWFFREGRKGEGWMMETISGVWEIDGNNVNPAPDAAPWKGAVKDSREEAEYPADIESVEAFPFKRIFSANKSKLSYEDAEDVVDAELDRQSQPIEIDDAIIPPADSFLIQSFDKITGERFAFSNYTGDDSDLGFMVFEDLLSALSYLNNDLLHQDEHVRTNGAVLCSGAAVEGSHNEIREKNTSEAIRQFFKKIAIDALTSGYKPYHSAQIKRLINDATVTTQILEIGYFKDLIFYGLSNGDTIEDTIGDESPNEKKQLSKIKSIRQKIAGIQNYQSFEIDTLRMSLREYFDLLTDDSKIIAKTAIAQFTVMGKQLNTDYAGISMLVCKIVEREIKHKIFNPWIVKVKQDFSKENFKTIRDYLNRDGSDLLTASLLDVIEKKRRTDLGTVKFIFDMVRESESKEPLLIHFKKFLKTLADCKWIVSEEHSSKIRDIYTRYRNGGVHEHLVTFETCHEALHTILIGKNPSLFRFLKASVPKRLRLV